MKSKLPKFKLDKHQALYTFLYPNSRDTSLMVYGTSHVRELLLLADESTLELETLEEDSANTRRDYLDKILSKEIIFEEDSPWDKAPEILLNITLSAETFIRIDNFIKTMNLKDNFMEFIKYIYEDDDYLVNWGGFPEFLKDRQSTFGPDEEVATFIIKTIRRLNAKVKISVDFKNIIKSTNDPYTKIIKKGTFLYRGYRKYRGKLDKYRDLAWFGFQYQGLWSYALPPTREDNLNFISKSTNFDFLDDYCDAIGGIAVFQLREDIEVLDFSDIVTVRYIKNLLDEMEAPKDVKNAFIKGWQIKEEEYVRVSIDRYDEMVSAWLCKNKFQGYLSLNVKGLYDEIMICDVHKKIEYIGTYNISKETYFHVCKPPYSNHNLYLHYW